MAGIIEYEDLVSNPTPRVPISLCLDCSGSMTGEPIQKLNEGVSAFYEAVLSDEIAKYSAEISIVSFGPVQLETEFQTLDNNPNAPVLTANGSTPMGEAVRLSLDTLEKRKLEYKNNGVDYYQPWLVLMTDGMPYGGSNAVLDEQIQRVQEMVESKKLTLFPIGIGKDAPMSVLARFSPGRTPLKLQGLNFQALFQWLSASVSRVSQSTPGDNVPLDVEGIKGWAEL